MKIAICDDEKVILNSIKEKTKRLFPAFEVQTFSSGEELLAKGYIPDILLLDIQMQGMNGMDVAKKLRKARLDTVIIFVTADSSCVFDAFDVGAFHYLVKPYTDEKFTEVLTNAVRSCKSETARPEESRQSLNVQYKGMHMKIYVDEIVYAEVYNRKVVIHTIEQEIEYYGKLKELAGILGEDFFQTHRAYLVHLKYVMRYDANCVVVKGGTIPMSKANFPRFVNQYLKYNQMEGRK